MRTAVDPQVTWPARHYNINPSMQASRCDFSAAVIISHRT